MVISTEHRSAVSPPPTTTLPVVPATTQPMTRTARP